MASKKTLNAKNLEVLGAARLAELLIEISAGEATAKRRLRLELAAAAGPTDVAHEIRKQLSAIARARAMVDWQNRKDFINDLQTQRRAIVHVVAENDPAEALDLLWQFMTLANSIMERCEDRSGAVIGVFHDACDTLGTVAEVARPDSKVLAERAFRALCENNYGQYDYLIEALTPALGSNGLDHLKQYVNALSTNQTPMPRDESRQIIGWQADGPVETEDYADRWRDSMIRLALQQIADAQGDVDAFLAQQSEAAKSVPIVAAGIAQRLLAAGRTDEAWLAINAIDEDRRGWIPLEWEQTRLRVLEALGRVDEAQTFRWACFERTLEIAHLQAYLKRLPDFEDMEAEERALSLGLGYADVHRALLFYVSWPAPSHAAELVLSRAAELDGYHYEILEAAADLVELKHPLAATVMRRALIDFALEKARSKRYRHAARHLLECESLAKTITDYGQFVAHEDYVKRLRTDHRRKKSFWSLLNEV
jgi:hypothetical protein